MTRVDMPPAAYRPCAVCHAPAIDPFPDTWILELIKEGPPSGPARAFLTPHRPDCTAPAADPQPGLAVRVPGASVDRMRVVPPPVRVGRGMVFIAPIDPGSEWPGGAGIDWRYVGHTDGPAEWVWIE